MLKMKFNVELSFLYFTMKYFSKKTLVKRVNLIFISLICFYTRILKKFSGGVKGKE